MSQNVRPHCQEEDQRHIREELSEEELAVFDLLTKTDVELTDAERKQVNRLAGTFSTRSKPRS
jgi:type I restriction enzyme, R subunit